MGSVVTGSNSHSSYSSRVPLQSRPAHFARSTPPISFRRRQSSPSHSTQPLPTKFDALHGQSRDRRRIRFRYSRSTTTLVNQPNDSTLHSSHSRQSHLLPLTTTTSSTPSPQQNPTGSEEGGKGEFVSFHCSEYFDAFSPFSPSIIRIMTRYPIICIIPHRRPAVAYLTCFRSLITLVLLIDSLERRHHLIILLSYESGLRAQSIWDDER